MTLHLDSLYISGFRGIPKLEIPRLGRVTLLAGKNGVGKTAVLDAVQVYAARSTYGVLATILRNHGELRRVTNAESVEMLAPDWNALFYGRDLWREPGIKIGPCDAGRQLEVCTVWLESEQIRLPSHYRLPDSNTLALAVMYDQQQWNIPIDYPLLNLRSRLSQQATSELPPEIVCNLLGTGLPSPVALARFWDEVVIRNEQSMATDALNLILNAPVEWVAAVGDIERRSSDRGRRVIVKIAGEAIPVPLQSLGDGATRIFGVALALVNSRDGFLLIDEAENGIHHSVQQDFWKLVLLAAQRYNVQVLATTHSGDCVFGFAKAVANLENGDGVYARLEKDDDLLRSVTYPNNGLLAAAQYGIETR